MDCLLNTIVLSIKEPSHCQGSMGYYIGHLGKSMMEDILPLYLSREFKAMECLPKSAFYKDIWHHPIFLILLSFQCVKGKGLMGSTLGPKQ